MSEIEFSTLAAKFKICLIFTERHNLIARFIPLYCKFHTMPCQALKFSTAQSVTQHRTLKAVTSHSLRVNKAFKYLIDSSNGEFGTPVI